jgi:hypothetical protein
VFHPVQLGACSAARVTRTTNVQRRRTAGQLHDILDSNTAQSCDIIVTMGCACNVKLSISAQHDVLVKFWRGTAAKGP